jgi:hypothetical protein
MAQTAIAGKRSQGSRLYSEWRATQNKTANSYVIEIASNFFDENI